MENLWSPNKNSKTTRDAYLDLYIYLSNLSMSTIAQSIWWTSSFNAQPLWNTFINCFILSKGKRLLSFGHFLLHPFSGCKNVINPVSAQRFHLIFISLRKDTKKRHLVFYDGFHLFRVESKSRDKFNICSYFCCRKGQSYNIDMFNVKEIFLHLSWGFRGF